MTKWEATQLITTHHMDQIYELDSNTTQISPVMLSTILHKSGHHTSSGEFTDELN